MLKVNRALPVLMSALLVFSANPAALAADGLNFKIYSPETTTAPAEDTAKETKSEPVNAFGSLKEETPTEDKIVEEAPKPIQEPAAATEAAAEPTVSTEAAAEPSTSTAETSSASGSASQPIDSLIDPEVKKAATTEPTTKKTASKPLLPKRFVAIPHFMSTEPRP